MLAAGIFKQEAISNARFNLKHTLGNGQAAALVSLTLVDVAAVTEQTRNGSLAAGALANRPVARELLRTLQWVGMSNAVGWWHVNMDGPIQAARLRDGDLAHGAYGQPLFWITISPADVDNPIVVKYAYAGVEMDI